MIADLWPGGQWEAREFRALPAKFHLGQITVGHSNPIARRTSTGTKGHRRPIRAGKGQSFNADGRASYWPGVPSSSAKTSLAAMKAPRPAGIPT